MTTTTLSETAREKNHRPDSGLQSRSELASASPPLLMCPPTHYGLKYEINPWMSLSHLPDTALAAQQWQELYRVLTEDAGASVKLLSQAENAPDMVFTANAGLTRNGRCILARFRHPERQVEEPYFAAWFAEHGYRIEMLPQEISFEGEGDALFAGEILLAGYLKRSDIHAHSLIAEKLDAEVLSLELVDDRWYHLDTCLFPLDEQTVVYYPGAFDSYAQTVLRDRFMTIEVDTAEALRFACNAVRVNRHIVLPSGCPELSRRLEARGYTVHRVGLSEFLKAGGAAKCLTLYLR